MQVTASDALLENNIALVGAIESGFYFTLDSMITPYQAGPMEILVSVSFTDDFNQPQSYDTTLLVDVIEMDMGDFGEGDDQFPPFEDFDDWEPSGRRNILAKAPASTQRSDWAGQRC